MISHVHFDVLSASDTLALGNAVTHAAVGSAPCVGHLRANLPQRWEEALSHTLLQQIDRAPLEGSSSHADRAVNQKDVVTAEFLHQLIELHQALGDAIRIVTALFRIVNRLDGELSALQIMRLEAAPHQRQSLHERAKSG